MKKVLNHFKKVDPVLYAMAVKFDPKEVFAFEKHTNYFERLCRAIAGQQLSVKASATIWGRFEKLLKGKELTPENVLKIKHEDMRGAGFSNAKVKYIHAMAEAIINGEVKIDGLAEMADEEVAAELIKLKGVGQWTAEMFLMFTLGREDLFSAGDLGLRRAMERLYGLTDPSEEELIKMAEKWAPYRTYACLVLWESLDNNPLG